MNLFDQLSTKAMQSDQALGTMRPAVEKELLHHDILREMSRAGLLNGLTFIGGTCLRACYGSPRLSEDLDFAGGVNFDPTRLADLASILEKTLLKKYGLPVKVSDPTHEEGNVSTWKLRLQTRPATKHLPSQRIHIDICAIPSHHPRPAMLRNAYGINMGTDGLILQAQTLEEILADKWIALAFRPNRIKHRDLWDIIWLNRQGIQLDASLTIEKLNDRQQTRLHYFDTLQNRLIDLKTNDTHHHNFQKEMERFLPATDIKESIHRPEFWDVLLYTLQENLQKLLTRPYLKSVLC